MRTIEVNCVKFNRLLVFLD